MKQRTERLGREIQSILGEILTRGEIKDPRVRNAGLLTVTRVHVTGDLREAKVAFTAFGAADPVLEKARQGLQSASPYLQRAIGQRLRTRNTPTLEFEVDHLLDEALRVDSILREVRAELAAAPAAEEAPADARAARGARASEPRQESSEESSGEGSEEGSEEGSQE